MARKNKGPQPTNDASNTTTEGTTPTTNTPPVAETPAAPEMVTVETTTITVLDNLATNFQTNPSIHSLRIRGLADNTVQVRPTHRTNISQLVAGELLSRVKSEAGKVDSVVLRAPFGNVKFQAGQFKVVEAAHNWLTLVPVAEGETAQIKIELGSIEVPADQIKKPRAKRAKKEAAPAAPTSEAPAETPVAEAQPAEEPAPSAEQVEEVITETAPTTEA